MALKAMTAIRDATTRKRSFTMIGFRKLFVSVIPVLSATLMNANSLIGQEQEFVEINGNWVPRTIVESIQPQPDGMSTAPESELSVSVPVDIVLAIDTTGSMGGVINQVKQDAQTIINNVRAQIPGARFGAIKFRDYGDAYVTQIACQPTSDDTAVRNAITSMSATGGGDTPEAYTEVMLQAVNGIGWRNDAIRLVVVIGDAPPHDAVYGTGSSPTGYTWASVGSLAANSGLHACMVAVGYGLSDGRVRDSYSYMALLTDGRYVESSSPIQVTQAIIAVVTSLSGDTPFVVSTNPARDAMDVSGDTLVQATFDKPLNPATANVMTVLLSDGATSPPYTVSVSPDALTLSITVPDGMEVGARYSVVLTDGVKGATGHPIARYEWSFSTAFASQRDRVGAKIASFARAMRETLRIHSDITASNTRYAYQALGSAATVDLLLAVADVLQSLVHPERLLAGPGARVSNGLRSLWATYANSGFSQIEKVWSWKDRAEALASFLTSTAEPDFGQYYRSRMPIFVDPPTEEGAPDYIGSDAVAQAVAALLEDAATNLPPDLSMDAADAAVEFLSEQITRAELSRSREVSAPLYDGRSCSVILLGQVTTIRGELEWGVAALEEFEDKKIALSLTRSTLLLVKIGGALLIPAGGSGTIVIALADAAYVGISVGEFAYSVADELGLDSPRDVVQHSFDRSQEMFHQEVLANLFFSQSTAAWAGHLAASGNSAVSGVASAGTSSTSLAEIVGGLVCPDVDTSVGVLTTGHIQVHSLSHNGRA